jgi:GH25 family lysozyme M1 (1,4-beta-N-acetylmuramidase)
MTYGYTDAYAGEFYQGEPSQNTNTLLNAVLTRPVKLGSILGAVVTQEIQFPDVSFYQEEIDYSTMRLNTDTIILRIGQNLWPDDQFERNYLEAKKSGMRIGGYWFYDGRISPLKQAELLVNLCAGKTFEMEIFIDWERSYGGGHEGLKNVVAMMELLDAAINMGALKARGTGMYTGYYFFRGNSNSVLNASQYNYLKNRPLWLAWYSNNPNDVLIPAPWTKLDLWQWGTPAWNWGQATKEIDMNWFNGTKTDFQNRYGIIGEQPPMSDQVKLSSTTTANRSLRRPVAYPQVPHIAGTYYGNLTNGTIVGASDFYTYASNIRYVSGTAIYEAFAGDKWWKVTLSDGSFVWVAEIHKGEKLLNVEVVPDPEPTPTLPTLLIDVKDSEGLYIPVTVELKPKS